MISGWLREDEFHNFVEITYDKSQVHGWGLYRVKEKLRVLKREIRVWNKGRSDKWKERALSLEKDMAK